VKLGVLVGVEELSRNALRIYVHILESNKSVGVRELARDLNLPVSTVHYSLRRLEELGLIRKSGEGYVINRLLSPEGFVVIYRKLIPRLIIYSSFFVGLLIAELSLSIASGLNPDRLVAIVASLIASVVLVFEGINLRRKYV